MKQRFLSPIVIINHKAISSTHFEISYIKLKNTVSKLQIRGNEVISYFCSRYFCNAHSGYFERIISVNKYCICIFYLLWNTTLQLWIKHSKTWYIKILNSHQLASLSFHYTMAEPQLRSTFSLANCWKYSFHQAD